MANCRNHNAIEMTWMYTPKLQDLWPTAFHVRTGTTNRIDLAWARVFYG